LFGWHSITQLRALWACRRARIPVVYRGDSNSVGRGTGLASRVFDLAWRNKTRLLLAQFSAYLSVGRYARTYLEEFGGPGRPIFDCPHVVDSQFFAAQVARYATPAARASVRKEFGAADDEYLVAFIGKFEEKKRPSDLVRAAARLSRVR